MTARFALSGKKIFFSLFTSQGNDVRALSIFSALCRHRSFNDCGPTTALSGRCVENTHLMATIISLSDRKTKPKVHSFVIARESRQKTTFYLNMTAATNTKRASVQQKHHRNNGKKLHNFYTARAVEREEKIKLRCFHRPKSAEN